MAEDHDELRAEQKKEEGNRAPLRAVALKKAIILMVHSVRVCENDSFSKTATVQKTGFKFACLLLLNFFAFQKAEPKV